MGHPVTCQNKKDSLFVNMPHDLTDRSIYGQIYITNRISGHGGNLGAVAWMVYVMKMPALVAGAMALRKHLRKEIPVIRCQKMLRQACLGFHPLDQFVSENTIF